MIKAADIYVLKQVLQLDKLELTQVLGLIGSAVLALELFGDE